MRIGVSMNVIPDGFVPAVDSINGLASSYVSLLQEFGILPILIPVNLLDLPGYAQAVSIDGILLTGGNDVSPQLYGNTSAELGSSCWERDLLEYALIDYALGKGLPVLGICRGMQLLNVYFGGALKRFEEESALQLHVRNIHEVQVVAFPPSSKAQKRILRVNSFHRHFVDSTTLSHELRAFAISIQDGVVEGVKHASLPVFGMQWHPERSGPSYSFDRSLIASVFFGESW